MPPSSVRITATPRTLPDPSTTGAPESPACRGMVSRIAWRWSGVFSSRVPVRPSSPRRMAGSRAPRGGSEKAPAVPKPMLSTGVPMLADSSSASAGAPPALIRISARSPRRLRIGGLGA